jgi:hypothetical protein
MQKKVHIGVPVLRRYDLLRKLCLSLEYGSVRPELITVIDNGKQKEKVAQAVSGLSIPVDVAEPDVPLGVAASWNWLIARLPEERIITNDDITFLGDSVEKMCATAGDLVFGHGYSCYLIRDSAVEKIGRFDEAISPGYAYWEDIDFDQRVRLHIAGGGDFTQVNAPCEVLHAGSQTNEWATPQEISEHHRKFELAKQNFLAKWSNLPIEQLHPAAVPHVKQAVPR